MPTWNCPDCYWGDEFDPLFPEDWEDFVPLPEPEEEQQPEPDYDTIPF